MKIESSTWVPNLGKNISSSEFEWIVQAQALCDFVGKGIRVKLSRNFSSISPAPDVSPNKSCPKMTKSQGSAFGFFVGQIKVVSNEQKSTQDPSKHQREAYWTLSQSTNVDWAHSRRVWRNSRKFQIPGKSQKSMHMPYEENLTNKKYLQMNRKQLKPIPNIKEKHFKHFSNWQMLSGVIPGASDPVWGNPDFGQF